MTTVTRWNPFREFDELFAQFGAVPAASQRGGARSAWVPPVDISETDAAYLIELDIPAVPIDAVSVQVKDGLLSISGERRQERAVSEGEDNEQASRRHRVERQYGSFARSFQLPEDADEEQIDASARDGVLTLSVAKREKAAPRKIEVKVH